MAIDTSPHNQKRVSAAACVTANAMVDRWTLTGTGSCCRICACTGGGRANR